VKQVSKVNKEINITPLTFLILFAGVVCDIFFKKSGQIFSSAGAVPIIYAVMARNK
jgi:hypothetical protein